MHINHRPWAIAAVMLSTAFLSIPAVKAAGSKSVAAPSSSTQVPATVRLGNTGATVMQLQRDLNALGYRVGAPDGQFGPMTKAGVQSFQKATRLPQTGTVDAHTWRSILAKLSQKQGSAKTSSPTIGRAPKQPTIVSDLRVTSIVLNGKTITRPYGFTYQGTTYMPIWYLMFTLKKIGIQPTWNRRNLALTIPTTMRVDLSNIHLNATGETISMNGTPVVRVPGLPYPDVYTHKLTEYMPIWYLQRALTRLGIHYDWNGYIWNLADPSITSGAGATTSSGGTSTSTGGTGVSSQPPTKGQGVSYVVYVPTGQSLGTYTSEDMAKSAIANMPGAVIADNTGHLVYTSPIPYVLYGSQGAILGLFTSLQQAETAIANTPGSVVKDVTGTVVLTANSAQSYSAYDGNHSLLGTYSTLLGAEQALGLTLNGTVVDASGSVVYTVPTTVTYEVYGFNSTLGQAFPTLAAAQAASAALPGSTIQDADGHVISLQPIQVPYGAYNSNGGLIGLYPSLSLAQQAIASIPGGVVEDANGNVVATQAGGASGGASSSNPPATDFSKVDLRFPAPADISATTINAYLVKQGSPLAGLGSTFMAAQQLYSVDANYLVSHAALESTWGKSQIALAKNNIYGYGAYDSNPGVAAGRFPSLEYAILYQAWSVRNNYLTPGAGLYVSPTLRGMNVNYASDPHWATSIASLMNQFATYVGDSVSSYPAYTSSGVPPVPTSGSEPVFVMNGAQAKIVRNPYYGGLPYYPDMRTGEHQMFARILQKGQIGGDVATMQAALNQQMNAGLTVDGDFGPMTASAVSAYQKAHALPVTGKCDYAMWSMLMSTGSVPVIPANQTVSVDAMMQGLSGGYVIEWYHIPNYGWVDSQYVQFTNVYRLTVSNPTLPSDTSIPIYSPSNPAQVVTTLHAGDFVVANSTTPSNGYLTVLGTDALTGKPFTGLINAATASLTAVQ